MYVPLDHTLGKWVSRGGIAAHGGEDNRGPSLRGTVKPDEELRGAEAGGSDHAGD